MFTKKRSMFRHIELKDRNAQLEIKAISCLKINVMRGFLY